jgi:hypothetical protein
MNPNAPSMPGHGSRPNGDKLIVCIDYGTTYSGRVSFQNRYRKLKP